MSPIKRTRIADVPVDCVDLSCALEAVDAFIAEGTPHYNVAINSLKVVGYHQDKRLRQAIDGAHLLTADGQPIVWASWLARDSVPGRANGTDMMEALIESAATKGHRLFFLGATEEIVRSCVDAARRRHPGISIVGYRNGYFTEADTGQIVEEVRAVKPDIVFLGFGTPSKEYFMLDHWQELGVPFLMGVGGSFDVYAGLVERAPRWMQRSGLEWFHRFLKEPGRMWRRYLIGNSVFVWLVLRSLAMRTLVGERRPKVA